MSYHIYETEGFVLGSHVSGEANKRYAIYTRDMGFVNASAQSVRLIKSKLRYHLDDYNFVNCSLVRGKEFWRLTSVKEIDDKASKLKGDNLLVFAKISGLLKRLLQGEESNDYLYKVINTGFRLLLKEDNKSEYLEALEILIVLKALFALGYVDKKKIFESLLENPEVKETDIESIMTIKTESLKAINQAIKESHL